jgi:hypothetical protein
MNMNKPKIYCNVVLIRYSAVEEIFLFIGEKEQISKQAESKFYALCEKYICTWDSYSEDSRKELFADGCVEFGIYDSICVEWPTVVK